MWRNKCCIFLDGQKTKHNIGLQIKKCYKNTELHFIPFQNRLILEMRFLSSNPLTFYLFSVQKANVIEQLAWDDYQGDNTAWNSQDNISDHFCLKWVKTLIEKNWTKSDAIKLRNASSNLQIQAINVNNIGGFDGSDGNHVNVETANMFVKHIILWKTTNPPPDPHLLARFIGIILIESSWF